MYKIKLYIKEKKEVLTIIDDISDKPLYRYVGNLGSLFAEFIECDLLDVDDYVQKLFMLYRNSDDDRTKELRKVTNLLPYIHLFFYIYSNKLYDIEKNNLSSYKGKKVIQTITHQMYNIRALQDYIRMFIEEIFDVDSKYESSKIVDIYNKIRKRNNDVSGSRFYEFSPVVNNIQYDFMPENEYKYKGFKNKKAELCPYIYPENIEDIIYFLFLHLFINNAKFKKCKNCGRYYVVTGLRNSEYCNRVLPDSNKTCRDIGSIKSYIKKRSSDPIKKAYTKAYNTRNARIRYGMITKEEFQKWAEAARIKREQCVNGEISLEEFEYWLNRRG